MNVDRFCSRLRKLLLPFVFCIFSNCFAYEEMSMSHDFGLKKLSDSKTIYEEYTVPSEQGTDVVYWISTGCENKDKKKILILIHGSPGSWTNYIRYLNDPELRRNYCMFSLDRPGFGRSTGAAADIKIQAERIWNTFPLSREPRKIFLLGHSYGGPVSSRIAVIASDHVEGLFLLAAAMDPEKEEPKWYNLFADLFLIKQILGSDWNRSNEEMLPLQIQLEELRRDWNKIRARTVVLQGSEDGLVDPGNLEFIRREFPAGTIRKAVLLPKEGHFLPWKNFKTVKELLLEDFDPKK